MKEINYTFAIGSNCDATFFIRRFDLCKFSGPMDWVYIDFETAIKNIQKGFERYTKDLFYYSPDLEYKNMGEDELNSFLFNPKYHDQVDARLQEISDKEFELHPDKPYVKDFFINQHFLPDVLDSNLVKWNRSCWFPHHDFKNEFQVNVLKNKITAFMKVYEDNKDNILFLGFNKFENLDDAYYYIRRCSGNYHRYKLDSDVFYIILAPTHTTPEVFKYDGITFFLKHFEGTYQFHKDTQLPEANDYLNSIYNFNSLEKPIDLDYKITTTFSDDYDEMIDNTLDFHSWTGD